MINVNLVPTNETLSWYMSLEKPFFAPPSWLFGIVWGLLYPIIFISFGYVLYLVYRKKLKRVVVLPFALNLFFNLIFSYIQFGLQNNLLAAIDISLVIITLLWGIRLIYPKYTLLAYIQIPYLLWGVFATVLQFSVTWLNW